jgi:hypothetical protein
LSSFEAASVGADLYVRNWVVQDDPPRLQVYDFGWAHSGIRHDVEYQPRLFIQPGESALGEQVILDEVGGERHSGGLNLSLDPQPLKNIVKPKTAANVELLQHSAQHAHVLIGGLRVGFFGHDPPMPPFAIGDGVVGSQFANWDVPNNTVKVADRSFPGVAPDAKLTG